MVKISDSHVTILLWGYLPSLHVLLSRQLKKIENEIWYLEDTWTTTLNIRPTIVPSPLIKIIYEYEYLAYPTKGNSILLDLIGSSVSEYPALFISYQNKMASRLVFVTEELFW